MSKDNSSLTERVADQDLETSQVPCSQPLAVWLQEHARAHATGQTRKALEACARALSEPQTLEVTASENTPSSRQLSAWLHDYALCQDAARIKERLHECAFALEKRGTFEATPDWRAQAIYWEAQEKKCRGVIDAVEAFIRDQRSRLPTNRASESSQTGAALLDALENCLQGARTH